MKNKLTLLTILLIFSIFCSAVPSYSAERFAREYSSDIDITKEAADVKAGRYNIRVDMQRPARPFTEIVFRIFITRNNIPVEIDEGFVKFNMSMDMGLYKTRLQKAATGYSAKITLPKCIFGGHRWFMKLEFEEGGFSAEKVFLFDMAK